MAELAKDPTKVIHRDVTRPAEIESIIDLDQLDQQDQCASCNVPIDRGSNYISIILSWEHWERGIPMQGPPGGGVTFDDAEELAIFCSEECLHDGLKRGIA